MNNINFENIELGIGVDIHPTAKIQGVNGKGKSIRIGDHTIIGERVQIMVDEFSIGDYGKIHHDTNLHGYKPLIIGHNFWCGQFCILDSIGGLTIGNNVGVGAQSQIWSHMKFGDTLAGCAWKLEKECILEDDVWILPGCIVSPITAREKSMALAGSIVTKDMEENIVYAGIPAQKKQVSLYGEYHRQFMNNYSDEEKIGMMDRWRKECGVQKIMIVNDQSLFDFNPAFKEISYFDVRSRTYTKRNTPDEIAFMKYLLPDRAKFLPI